MGKRGQPKIGEDFEILVYIKIVQYCNRYNIGPMKAWEKLTTHKAFRTYESLARQNKICNYK